MSIAVGLFFAIVLAAFGLGAYLWYATPGPDELSRR
jgi:hypothetical protein